MKPIPFNKPGADNDLNEKLGFYVDQAIADGDAVVYAFLEKSRVRSLEKTTNILALSQEMESMIFT